MLGKYLTAPRSILAVVLSLGLHFAAAGIARAQGASPPVLTAFTLPAAIDVSTGPADLGIGYSLADDFSGSTYISVVLMPPGQGCGPTLAESFSPALLREGTLHLTLGQFSTAIGAWTVCSVYVADAVGSQHTYSTAEVEALGFATTFTVTGVQDVAEPVLSMLRFPASIDVSNGPAQVVVDYALTDDVSGSHQIYLGLQPPGGGCGGYASAAHMPSLVVSGSLGFQLGQFSTPIGRWQVCDLYVADAVGNGHHYSAAGLEALGLPSGFDVVGTQDTMPPHLTALALPAVADVSTGGTTLSIAYSVSDDLSGASYVSVLFMPPGQGCGTGTGEGFAAALAHSDTLELPLGQFSTPIGVWTLCSITLTDAVGNQRTYSGAEVEGLGFSTSFTTIGTQDLAPPELTALSLVPVVDISTASATMMIDYTVIDDASGATYISVQLMPPGLGCGPTPQEGFPAALSRSGALTLGLGQYATPIGTWTICTVYVADAVGNIRYYAAPELMALGLPTSFSVIGTQDVTPPELTGLTLPEVVDVSVGPAELTVEYAVSDDLSGATYITVSFMPPGQSCGMAVQDWFSASLARDGAMSLSLGQFTTVIGSWTVCSLYVVDAVGNSRTYSGAEIAGLGFPAAVDVVGTQDVTAPVLESVRVAPTTLHLQDSPHRVLIEYSASDDLSGANLFEIRWNHPSFGCGYPGVSDWFQPVPQRDHVAQAILGRGLLTLGAQPVCGLRVCDAVGNCRAYDAAEILAQGWTLALDVLAGSDPGAPAPAVDASGAYEGSWRDSMGYGGFASAIVVQTGGAIAGEARIAGADCLSATTLSGRVQGDTLLATAANETNQLDLRLEVTEAGLEGIFEIAQGCFMGTTGSVVLARLPTPTPTLTTTYTPSRTSTRTITATRTATATRSSTPTATHSVPPTPTPSVTATGTVTATRTSTATFTATPTATPTPAPCVNDCNGDGQVTIEELVRGVAIGSGLSLSVCPAADPDQNGEVSKSELIEAVGRALVGCG